MNAKQRHTFFTRLQAQNPRPTTELNYNSYKFQLLGGFRYRSTHPT